MPLIMPSSTLAWQWSQDSAQAEPVTERHFGIEVTDASATVRNCVLSQGLQGIAFLPSTPGRVVTIDHCTIATGSRQAHG